MRRLNIKSLEIRCVNDKGTISIPINLRERFGIKMTLCGN